jgi:hydrocephalus-inducing protein
VRFESDKEQKLKTTKTTSDIKLNILEGKSLEVFKQIPIDVNVNAVFSKYTITPLKNINFGPMQYDEKKTRFFEVKNEGLFEFKYAICDFNDQEGKDKIIEERKTEVDERRKEALGIVDEGAAANDPKKKPDPKAAAAAKGKDAKGAGAPATAEGGPLNVTQYTITPSSGSIPPGNSAKVQVEFKAVGAQFYENQLAVDISGRDP